jgi:hypothetical protein
MKTKLFEHHFNYELPTQQEITFFFDENGCNPIFDQFQWFLKDMFYCPFTGMMFDIIEQDEVEVKCSILTGHEINQMRDILFERIKLFENQINPRYYNFQINTAFNTWNSILELPSHYLEGSPWDIADNIESVDRNLLYINNNSKPVHYVYLFYDTITKCHKIGHTNNVNTRYKTLLSDRNSIVEITSFILNDKNYAIKLEKTLHNKFEKYRDIGEWFKFNDLENQQIINRIYDIAEELKYEICEVDEYESRNHIF